MYVTVIIRPLLLYDHLNHHWSEFDQSPQLILYTCIYSLSLHPLLYSMYKQILLNFVLYKAIKILTVSYYDYLSILIITHLTIHCVALYKEFIIIKKSWYLFERLAA